ncbi:MAG: DUF3800 domain-containing protein [Methanomassiliicoccaceae archaeon]|nr:DUF3800 domain-containing protein [Methanomassiliicoccaceae archaeon]
MYLAYLDESGKPDLADSEKEFVLAALLVNEREWMRIDKAVTRLKLKYFPDKDPESFEFHTTDIISHKGVFKGLDVAVRLGMVEDLLNVVSEAECWIASVVIRKGELKNPGLDVGMFAMKLMFERLCCFLDSVNGTKPDEDREYGILLVDSVDRRYDNKVRSKIKELCREGSGRVDNRFLIEDPIFVESKYRHMSQLADCVAFCVRRRHRSKPSNPKDEETFERFYRMIGGKVFKCDGCGIKVFPKGL